MDGGGTMKRTIVNAWIPLNAGYERENHEWYNMSDWKMKDDQFMIYTLYTPIVAEYV